VSLPGGQGERERDTGMIPEQWSGIAPKIFYGRSRYHSLPLVPSSTFEYGLAQKSDPCQVEGMERQQGEAALQHPASKDLVVFSILRDSQCAECGEALWKGNFLLMEKERPLCLHAPISITWSTCPVVMLH
jgi:hypothetical protein